MSDTEIKKPKELSEEEKARDAKCIPVARWILNDMAMLMIPENANDKIDFTPIVLKMLGRTLEADMNIATEVSYVPQLILSVLSGLNKAVQECDFTPVDDVRYGKIAKQILSIVAVADIRMNAVTPEESAADFAPVKEQLKALFTAEKLSLLEIKYVMDTFIFNSFTTVNNIFSKSLQDSTERAEAKLFGVESMSDLTMKKLDGVLLNQTAPKEEAKS